MTTNNATPTTPGRIYLAGASGRVVHMDPGEKANSCAGMTLGAEFAARPAGKRFAGLNGEPYSRLSESEAREVASWSKDGAVCDCEHDAAIR